MTATENRKVIFQALGNRLLGFERQRSALTLEKRVLGTRLTTRQLVWRSLMPSSPRRRLTKALLRMPGGWPAWPEYATPRPSPPSSGPACGAWQRRAAELEAAGQDHGQSAGTGPTPRRLEQAALRAA